MSKNFLCSVLIISILNLICYSNAPQVKTAQDNATQIKDAVNKIGENHKVEVKLLDGRKIKGFIKQIKADSFIVVDGYEIINNNVVAVDKTNSAIEIQFSQVKQIKSKGIGAIGGSAIVVTIVAIGAGAVLLFGLLLSQKD
ncbi:MAG: hypothetical protein K1X72_19460 [Pyrinomonadaceae bacterium]|nr:hypothetical protein [Pyrinomonadaceae bacterium]